MRCIAKKTLHIAKETGNDVIVQVKGNQKTLLNDCQTVAATTIPDDVYQEPMTKTRNRLESRKVELFFYPLLTDFLEWGLVKVVIKVTRSRRVFKTKTKTWKESDEISYYISTIDLSARIFCQAIRNHWGIENRDHYVRDVAMGEDKFRRNVQPVSARADTQPPRLTRRDRPSRNISWSADRAPRIVKNYPKLRMEDLYE